MAWNLHYKMPFSSSRAGISSRGTLRASAREESAGLRFHVMSTTSNPVPLFHPAVREWFARSFPPATRPQVLGGRAIARGDSTLIFPPTGSEKTLTAFLWCLDRAILNPPPEGARRCRVVYISP